MRIMAIDYGDAHTGIAISDPTGFLTGTTTTIHSRKAEEVAGEIARLVQEHGVEELVMGYPRNMDGPGGAVPGRRSPGGGHRGAPARALGRTADHRGRPPYPV